MGRLIPEAVALDDERGAHVKFYCGENPGSGSAVSGDEAVSNKSHLLAGWIPDRGLLTDLHAGLPASEDINAVDRHTRAFVGCHDTAGEIRDSAIA